MTAKKFIEKNKLPFHDHGDNIEAMVLFAKYHVEAALEAAYRNYELDDVPYTGCYECSMDDKELNKQSILNAYPLRNIK